MFARLSRKSSAPRMSREIRAWMARALETTAELDYTEAMAWFGLRMTPPPAAPRAYLGVTTRTENGKTIVTGIRRGSPAAAAGMSLLDEIVGDRWRAASGRAVDAAARAELSPGIEGDVRQSRARREHAPLNVALATDPGHGCALSASARRRPRQSQHLDALARHE